MGRWRQLVSGTTSRRPRIPIDQANAHFSTIDDNAGPPLMAISRLIIDGRSPTLSGQSGHPVADIDVGKGEQSRFARSGDSEVYVPRRSLEAAPLFGHARGGNVNPVAQAPVGPRP